jgi:hypothetical protein
MVAARRMGRAIAIEAAPQGSALAIQDQPESDLAPRQTRRPLPAKVQAQPADRQWRFADPYRRLSGSAVLRSAPTQRSDADKGHCGGRRRLAIEQEVFLAFKRSRCG